MLPDSGTAQKEGREPPPLPPPLFCKNKINLAKMYLLHRGGTIFVSDQLSQKVKRAVNLRAYRQDINKLALIMDFFPPPLQMCPILATKKPCKKTGTVKCFLDNFLPVLSRQILV